jgi:outer membrane lipoprotein-sorting protein
MIRRILPICPLLFVLSTTGCLFRSHKVENHISSAVLKSATQQELIDIVNKDADRIKTMNATVDIRAAAGGQKKGKVTEYTEIRGYILAEKPTMLRMIGLFPVVRNRAFDMVSDGANFKLWIPPKNKFIVGRNDVIKPNPSQPLENLRPQHIYDALLLPEIDPKNEIAVLEGGTEQVTDPKTRKPLEQANYVLNVIRHDPEGRWTLSRKIFFDRVTLTPYRQIVYDKQGNVATDAEYADYRDFNGIRFPGHIEITRPQEEYNIGLSMVTLKLNEPLKPDQFELQQPANAQVVHLTNDTTSSTATTTEK